MNHVHRKKDAQGNSRAYVGDLKKNRKVIWKGVEQKISEVAASIPIEDRKEPCRRPSAPAVVQLTSRLLSFAKGNLEDIPPLGQLAAV